MTNNNPNPLLFYPLIETMEKILGTPTATGVLCSNINQHDFIKLRTDIISAFEVGELPAFSGDFSSEVELGDVSDAVRMTTFSRYPQSTPMEKPISREERKEWCLQILKTMDEYAEFGQ